MSRCGSRRMAKVAAALVGVVFLVNMGLIATTNLSTRQGVGVLASKQATDRPSTLYEGIERARSQDETFPCFMSYGLGLLERWNREAVDVCQSESESSIVCYDNDWWLPGTLKATCVGKGVVVRPSRIITSVEGPLEMKPGALSGNCKIDKEVASRYVSSTRLWLVDGFESSAEAKAECHTTITDPVFLISRYNSGNLFHFLEDLSTAFVTLLQVRTLVPDRLPRVIFVDGEAMPDGPFYSAWSRLFSQRFEPLHILELNDTVCMDTAVIPTYAGVSLLSFEGVGLPTSCTSDVVKGFSRWIRRGFGLSSMLPSKRSIVWVKRVSSQTRELKRTLANEGELVAALKLAVPSYFPAYDFVAVDYASLAFEDQLELDAKVKVLMGVHGAGLAHSMFIPDDAAVVEVFLKESDALNYHYYNFATWRGLDYWSVTTFNTTAETRQESESQHKATVVDVRSLIDGLMSALQAGLA